MGIFKYFDNTSIYYSNVQGTPILDEGRQKIGFLTDFFVNYEEVYPTVLAIQFKMRGSFYYIAWNDIKRFSFKEIVIKNSQNIREGRTFPLRKEKRHILNILASQYSDEDQVKHFPPLGKVVLDRQIVDTYGKKVVRVNDIQFIKAGKSLRVTHAAIGFRSMLRRLGFESIVAAFVKTCCPNAKFFINEPLINWKFVHTIPNKSLKENLQLKLSNQDLKQMHPADLADILEDLDNTNRKEILEELSPELAAQTLSELEPDVQNQLIKYENPIKIAQYVEHMGTDEAADLLSDFSEDKTDAIISNIQDNDFQEEVQELLEYEENTAGGLMSTEVFDVNKNFSRSTIIKKIQEEHDNLDSIYDIYVTDPEEKLLGTCSLSKILIEVEDIKIQELMNIEDIKSLHHSTPWRDVAEYMSKYNLITVPITDDENKLLGVVTVDDILPWLLNQR